MSDYPEDPDTLSWHQFQNRYQCNLHVTSYYVQTGGCSPEAHADNFIARSQDHRPGLNRQPEALAEYWRKQRLSEEERKAEIELELVEQMQRHISMDRLRVAVERFEEKHPELSWEYRNSENMAGFLDSLDEIHDCHVLDWIEYKVNLKSSTPQNVYINRNNGEFFQVIRDGPDAGVKTIRTYDEQYMRKLWLSTPPYA